MLDKEIHIFCRKHGIENYTIEDGLVNVDGDVNLTNSRLTKMPLKFGKVSGNFDCSFNYLKSLDGVPLEVGKDFECAVNNLTSLRGSPIEVGGDFKCGANDLISLEGSPLKIGGSFICKYNNLKSLDGAPLKVGGDFHCLGNKKGLSYERYLKKMNRLNKLKELNG